MSTHEERLQRARLSLEGLSVGDAFGDQFFVRKENATEIIDNRDLHNPIWYFTDDTNMALSIFSILRQHQTIKQDALSESFAEQYHPERRYGGGMRDMLRRTNEGESWQKLASGLFDGTGSYGNGAAMRVAPLGAYFADDIEAVIEQAKLSGDVTHTHPEGIAGAIAVAVATSVAWQLSQNDKRPSRQQFIDLVLPHIPESEVKSKTKQARDISDKTSVANVAKMIGSGYKISAQDTVPFVLWCAGEQLDNFEEAMWLTAAGLGDVDTTCAMVGGIVAMFVGQDGIPAEWIKWREPLTDWALS